MQFEYCGRIKSSKYFGVSLHKNDKWRYFVRCPIKKRTVTKGYTKDEYLSSCYRDYHEQLLNEPKSVYNHLYNIDISSHIKDYIAFHDDEDELVRQLMEIYIMDLSLGSEPIPGLNQSTINETDSTS